MAQGRGSASQAKLSSAAILLLCFLVCLEIVDAATYTVGDSGGWTFNMVSWPKGKRFRAGDVLVFNYDATIHNVVAVNRGGYTGCTTPAGAKVYSSGKDQVKLAKGLNFFICNTAGHCESGMKIAINAV
ncbi:Plastocyanin-like protein [Corchorus olitorius]|uniref:Basic blue protein n=1 Tax=Corchorus olitorius TaxID=93759 RepID=A0A1R3HK89_9ROSI|nr:Plastocyanin-like protein [Corchorus olitorius]